MCSSICSRSSSVSRLPNPSLTGSRYTRAMALTDSRVVQRVLAFRRTTQFARLWRYAVVSVISTVITLGLLYLFFRTFHVGSALFSNVLATMIATLPAYYLNRNWAWGKTGKSHVMREVVPFWVIAVIGLVLSSVAVDFADRAAHHLNAGHKLETLLVEGANFATYAVIWVGKFLLFNKVLFVDRAEGLEDVVAAT